MAKSLFNLQEKKKAKVSGIVLNNYLKISGVSMTPEAAQRKISISGNTVR